MESEKRKNSQRRPNHEGVFEQAQEITRACYLIDNLIANLIAM